MNKNPRLAKLFVSVVAIGAFAFIVQAMAQPMPQRQMPQQMLPALSAYLASSPKTELEDRSALFNIGAQLYAQGMFADIEKITNKFVSEKSRTPSGLWKVGFFTAGIQSAASPGSETDQYYKAALAQLRKWLERHPQSGMAHIQLSNLLLDYALYVRGDEPDKDVRPESKKRFNELLDEAERALEVSRSFASVNPVWHSTRLLVATFQERNKPKFDRLFKEAMAQEPGFFPTHFAAVRYFSPVWGGSDELMDQYFKEYLRSANLAEEDAMYARIYWYISQSICGCNVFSDTKAKWPRFSRSFEAVIKKYPDDWNLNHYAKFACEARDFSKAAELIDRLQGRFIGAAWGDSSVLANCAREIERARGTKRSRGG